ncbi:hypothetical protein K504DRAFT_464426 [Pleomassaria siparia CBS 279.74]|uniref:Uncharacterized protein n=1 Tax=Pleomassaria siparia CBS 279.74 TaxID=1314801 RepID=A0A6G1KIF9_9PLEO|nr:hypothetical protein K504DRAFT_464426 [Pleomassaria siparia CBS 279.74]
MSHMVGMDMDKDMPRAFARPGQARPERQKTRQDEARRGEAKRRQAKRIPRSRSTFNVQRPRWFVGLEQVHACA